MSLLRIFLDGSLDETHVVTKIVQISIHKRLNIEFEETKTYQIDDFDNTQISKR